MDNKEYIKLLGLITTLENTVRSNVKDDDLLIVMGFLLLLRREDLLEDPKEFSQKTLIIEMVEESISFEHSVQNKGSVLYNQYLRKYNDFFYRDIHERILKVNESYLKELYHIIFGASDEVIENHSKDLFDVEIKKRLSGRFGLAYDVMQPAELTSLINYFCDFKNMDSYYNPFAGLASLAMDLPSHFKYVGEELTGSTCILAQLRIMIHQVKAKVRLTTTDSLKSLSLDGDNREKFDFIGFYPPFNLRLSNNFRANSKIPYVDSINANAFIINQSFEKLQPEGKMVLLIPSGFLFSRHRNDVDLKKKLVRGGHLEKVIALPQRIFNYTGVNVNLLVINKKGNIENRVEFIDASEKYISGKGKVNVIDIDNIIEIFSDSKHSLKRYVSKKEVAENEYNLSVNRFVFEELDLSASEEENLMSLEEIIEPIRIVRHRPQANVKIVRIRDLAEDSLQFIKTFEDIEMRKVNHSVGLLEPNSLLLATTWKKLKPTLYQGLKEDVYYETTLMMASKVNEDVIDMEYLISELNKDYVQKQFEQFSTVVSVQRVSKKDLLQIKIVVPDKVEQQRRMLGYKQSIILKNKEKLEDLQKQLGVDIADENSFLRHKISGTLNNVLGSFAKLKTIIDSQVSIQLPEIYGYKADPRYNATLKDYLDRMDRDLDSIQKAVKRTGTELSLREMKFKTINFVKFVEDYSKELQNRPGINCEISFYNWEEDLSGSGVKEVYIHADPDFLRQAFDNIVENAQIHGFKMQKHDGSLSGNEIEIELFYELENSEVELHFSNSGNPLPTNFSFEAFTRKGSSSGINGGNGTGGWLINEIVKAHKGKLEVRNDVEDPLFVGVSPLPTTIILTFPMEIKI